MLAWKPDSKRGGVPRLLTSSPLFFTPFEPISAQYISLARRSGTFCLFWPDLTSLYPAPFPACNNLKHKSQQMKLFIFYDYVPGCFPLFPFICRLPAVWSGWLSPAAVVGDGVGVKLDVYSTPHSTLLLFSALCTRSLCW